MRLRFIMKKTKVECRDFSLTVVVPFFNSEKTIRATLESITTQSNCDWRIVLVNDGSLDESRNIAQEFQSAFSDRICIIDIENSGLSIARDVALSSVETDWMMYLDSDDLLMETVLDKISESLVQSNDNVIVMDYIVESNNQSDYISNNKFDGAHLTNTVIIKALKNNIQFSLSTLNVIYRTDYIRRHDFKFSIINKLPNSEIKIKHMQGEEIMFALKAIYFSDKIKYISLALAKYVLRQSSLSYSFDYSRLGAFYNVKDIIDSFCNASDDDKLKHIIRNHYIKSALNGLIFNFHVMKKTYENNSRLTISYSRLVTDSIKYYPMLLCDYRRMSFKNIFTRNVFKLSTLVNFFFSICPVLTLNLSKFYFNRMIK